MEREEYMALALALAREAADAGEVPVGCVIADGEGRVIGRGRNRREESGDATAHAEVEAIRQACAALGNWRLENCSIYVTLEPCPMCTGAIINSRIPTVVFGARETLSGSCGSVIDLFPKITDTGPPYSAASWQRTAPPCCVTSSGGKGNRESRKKLSF